ncbi:MAG: response regulator [Bacteroidetes bacterium]|nr:response regulator [Bacteroidota bacterium]
MIKILAIDDNNDNLVVLQAMLTISFPGVIYCSARSGKEGIEKAGFEKPDLILLDLVMPGLDGFETCRILKSDPALQRIPVIILTAEKTDSSSRIRALQLGADSFLSKPIVEAELIAVVTTMVRVKQSEDIVHKEKQLLEQTIVERTRVLQLQLEDLKTADRELKKSYEALETTKQASLNLMEDLKAEVDQRKRSEETLKESQQKFMELSIMFRSISDNMTDMLWAKDLDKKFIFANKSVCDNLLVATDTDEPIGKGDMFFANRQRELHPDNPVWHTFGELCIDSDQVVIESGKPGQFDEFGNVKGKFLFLDVRKSPLYDLNGKMIGTVGSAQDSTSEREMSKQLAQSEQQLSTLVSNLPGMVYRCKDGYDGKMLFVSDGCMAVTGYPREDFIENETVLFNDIILEEYRETVWKKWQDVLVRGEMFEGEYPIKTATGKTKWVWERCRGIYNDNGDILYLEGYIEDISVRRAAEEAIKKLNDELENRVSERTAQLEAANKELEAFSYSVSHDLRAPLRAIDGFTRILFEDYKPLLDDEGKRVCSVIQENAVRMGQLIDDLLALSRLNRSDLHLARINMENLAKVVYAEITSPEEKLRTSFNVSNVHSSMGDNVLVRQVVVNLIGNAIKFSSQREQAVITLSSEIQQDMVVYCIADNGAGFDMKYLDKLFGAFQRLHSVKEFDGTGIGLAIVQRIIHRHGGKVWAKGEIDKGASFYFSLPLKVENEG